MIDHEACPVCGHAILKQIGQFEMHATDAPADIRQAMINTILSFVLQTEHLSVATMQCAACRHIFTNPTFDEQELDLLYSSERTRRAKKEFRLSEQISNRSWAEQNNITRKPGEPHAAPSRAEVLHDLITSVSDKSSLRKICDFGGRTGELVEGFVNSDRFIYDKDLSNLNDPSVVALSSFEGFVENSPYDLIVLSHVLEHVPFPTALLKAIRPALRDGGYIYIEVPLEYCGAVIRRKGIPLVPHVNYFSKSSLLRCLLSAGFECISLFQRSISPYEELTLPVYKVIARNRSAGKNRPKAFSWPIELLIDSFQVWKARH